MAGLSDSNRDLWQFIAGHAVFRPKNLIENELKRDKDKILAVLDYYRPISTPSGEQLKEIKTLQGVQLEFVQRLSIFLALDEKQSYDLYCSFVLRDYRGSKKELQTVLASDRYCQLLMIKIQEFYNAERLYLLQTLKHLLSFWQESTHPYASVYEDFVQPLYESTNFIDKMTEQYDKLCSQPVPTSTTRGHPVHDRQPVVWYVQNLREQCEMLEIILLYYRSANFPISSFLERLTAFKKQGFGRRQTNKHLLDETSEHFVRRIGFLQVLILLVGLDLEEVQEKQLSDDLSAIVLLQSEEFPKLSAIMGSLDDAPEHGPLVLAWSVFRQISSDPKGGVWARKLGNKALELETFKYLCNQLSSEPFCGKTIVASTGHCVVYGLLCCVLSVYHEDTLGDAEGLYRVAANLMKQPFLSQELWARGLKDGLGNLLSSAASRFPFDFKHLMDLCVPLTQASPQSARHVVNFLQSLPIYTEFVERSTEVKVTSEQAVWQLAKDRVPYSGCDFVIPAGVFGQMHPQSDSDNIIQWQWRYSAFNVLLGETQRLSSQIVQGAGMVSAVSIERVTQACQLTAALMSVEEAPEIPQISSLVSMIYNLIQRVCQIPCPPLELLAACLQVLTQQVSHQPLQVWHNLKLTGFLPFLTENIDNYAEAASGAGLNIAAYGSLLAGAECSQGKYPVTVALLDLIAALVQPLHKANCLHELMAYVIFMGREVYPSFHKWRFQRINTREHIGQRCLEIFHQILNILTTEQTDSKPSVREVCVYTLLYTESARTLLNMIGTGVDTIEKAIASQGSAQEGFGVELIHSVRLAISVLNRLLLLRPTDLPSSPMEESLSAQPANRTTRHIVATIAQYMFHHHDPRLPSMATLLLKRLAMLFPMSMLACLGSEAEPLRDVFLARLEAYTEDVELKMRMLQLLSVCVEMQPGLIEIFLNIKFGKDDKSAVALSFGKSSCLQSVLDLISVKKQKSGHCPSVLLSAALEFLYALWKGRRETALSVLREKEEFWPSICLSLTRNLQEPGTDVADFHILATEVRSIANIMRIIALEVYHIRSDSISTGLKNVLEDLNSKGRFEYWSNYLSLCLKHLPPTTALSPDPTEHCSLALLLAWRDLMLVLSTVKGTVSLTDHSKDSLLSNLLSGIRFLFASSELSPLQVKLSSVASACYLTLLNRWIASVSNCSAILEMLEEILSQTCSNSEVLVPSVQIGLIASLALLLQHVRDQKQHVDSFQLTSLIDVVCSLVQQSTYQLPRPVKNAATPAKVPRVAEGEEKSEDFDVRMKLQCVAVCLLEELISLMQSSDWLQTLKQHCTVQTLLHSLPTWIQVRQGFSYVQTAFNLFLTISQCPEGAELLACSGLTQQLCVVAMETYSPPPNGDAPGQSRPLPDEWRSIHASYLALMASTLSSLKYNFLEDAFNFVGVHHDRLHQCLDSVGLSLSEGILQEAVPSCCFLAQLSHFPREWRLHMLDTMNTLMLDVCILTNRCVSLLIRPTLLQHMVEKQSRGDTSLNVTQDKLKVTPLLKRLSSQSSSNEDSEGFSHSVLQIQNRLLQILSYTLTALENFSPDFCEILLDQSVDISECEPLLRLGFSAPSVEADASPSFGTLLSCLNMGLKLLPKATSKSDVSPIKSADQEPHPFKKSLLLRVMESCWVLIMSQSVRYLKEPEFPSREKQLLKRELSAELTSLQMSLNRHIRRGPGSPAHGPSVSPQPGSSSTKLQVPSSASLNAHQDLSFFRTIDIFIRQVLR